MKPSIICKLGDSCAVQDLTLLIIYVVLLPVTGVKVVVWLVNATVFEWVTEQVESGTTCMLSSCFVSDGLSDHYVNTKVHALYGMAHV